MSSHDEAYIREFQPSEEEELEQLLSEIRHYVIERDRYREYLVNFKALWTDEQLEYIRDQYRRCQQILCIQRRLVKVLRHQIWLKNVPSLRSFLWAEYHHIQRGMIDGQY